MSLARESRVGVLRVLEKIAVEGRWRDVRASITEWTEH